MLKARLEQFVSSGIFTVPLFVKVFIRVKTTRFSFDDTSYLLNGYWWSWCTVVIKTRHWHKLKCEKKFGSYGGLRVPRGFGLRPTVGHLWRRHLPRIPRALWSYPVRKIMLFIYGKKLNIKKKKIHIVVFKLHIIQMHAACATGHQLTNGSNPFSMFSTVTMSSTSKL